MRLLQQALFAQTQPSSGMPKLLPCLSPHNEASREHGIDGHAVVAKLRSVAGFA